MTDFKRFAVLVFGMAAMSASANSPGADLAWQPCGVGAECTTIPVPLDWEHPQGEKITLAFARHRATDPARRIGALVFMNGMGASSMDYVAPRIGAGRFPAELIERFDIIGIDPRGGGVNPSGRVLNLPVASTNLECQLPAHTVEARYFPQNRDEFERLVAHNRAFAESCGPLAGYTGALSHARDVEAVRAALGERQISWMSWTTGSMVGLVYAKLHPNRVRAMALDQPFDSSAPELLFVAEHARAVQDQFDRFKQWCEETPTCALYGEDVSAALRALIAQANETPITATGPTLPPEDEGAAIDHPFIGDEMLIMIEQLLEIGDIEVAPGLTGFDAIAWGIYEAAFGSTSVFPGSYMYSAGWPGFWNRYRVGSCTDFDFRTHSYWQHRAVARLMEVIAPDMRGMSQAWDMYTGCIGWPLRTEKPVRTVGYSRTLPEVLVMSSRHSAYAPYRHAKRIVRRLPRAELLTYDGDTHIVFLSSECAKDWMVNYFVTGDTPPRGTVCPQEGLLVD